MAMLSVASAIGPPGPLEPCVTDSVKSAEAIPTEGKLVDLEPELVADGLDDPTGMFTLPSSDSLFVVEKPGRIVMVDEDRIVDPPVLDMTPLVLSEGNERGFLSAVPDPDYATNCHLFLFYVDFLGDSQLARVTVEGSEQPHVDLRTMTQVFEVPQDQRWHQSGSMVFGPDGHLWVTIGDGGFIGDPHGHGQNPNTLEGTVVRVDVSDLPYSVPQGNPFVDTGEGREEVWAYGLRNPWRISIDEEDGVVYIPDAGLTEREEINAVPLAATAPNFGWAVTEGTTCYEADECETSGLVDPVIDWPNDGNACAVVGGEVYRGGAIPEMEGHYFYGDFCLGWVRTFRYESGEVREEREWESLKRNLITSFSSDASGELYYTTFNGELWKILPRRES